LSFPEFQRREIFVNRISRVSHHSLLATDYPRGRAIATANIIVNPARLNESRCPATGGAAIFFYFSLNPAESRDKDVFAHTARNVADNWNG
jgi:hypothetical protein